MMKYLTKWIPALAMAVVLVQVPITASAQVERHIVTIEKGKVFIDGIQVPDDELPTSLKIRNMSASMNFTGDALLELNGAVFQLLDGKLVEADADVAREGRLMVFFSDPTDDESVLRVLSRAEADEMAFGKSTGGERKYGMVMENYFVALENKAKEFEVIRGQIASQNAEQTMVLADRLRLEAENTARMAKAFPRVEFESYLEGIQETDASLYKLLVQENGMEAETHRLAMEARATSSKEEREKIVQRLRATLEEAFELKQQNREKEIQQLSLRLDELRQRIADRSDARNRIIEARLKELLGELDW